MNLVIVPLVKCKSGDLSDVNNYRAVCISTHSTAMSKLVASWCAVERRTRDQEVAVRVSARHYSVKNSEQVSHT